MTGNTTSWDFPTTSSAFDTSYNDDYSSDYYGDAFVAKVNPAGGADLCHVPRWHQVRPRLCYLRVRNRLCLCDWWIQLR